MHFGCNFRCKARSKFIRPKFATPLVFRISILSWLIKYFQLFLHFFFSWGQTGRLEGLSDELHALTLQPWDCPEYLKDNHLNTIICAISNTTSSGSCPVSYRKYTNQVFISLLIEFMTLFFHLYFFCLLPGRLRISINISWWQKYKSRSYWYSIQRRSMSRTSIEHRNIYKTFTVLPMDCGQNQFSSTQHKGINYIKSKQKIKKLNIFFAIYRIVKIIILCQPN